jgi:hypothetical protein
MLITSKDILVKLEQIEKTLLQHDGRMIRHEELTRLASRFDSRLVHFGLLRPISLKRPPMPDGLFSLYQPITN